MGSEGIARARDHLIAALARAVPRCAYEGDREAACIAYEALGALLLLDEDGPAKALELYERARAADTGAGERACSLVAAILNGAE